MTTLTRTGQVCLHHDSNQIHFIAGNIRLMSTAGPRQVQRGAIEKPSVYKTGKRTLSEFTGIHVGNPENRCNNSPVSWDLVLMHSFYTHTIVRNNKNYLDISGVSFVSSLYTNQKTYHQSMHGIGKTTQNIFPFRCL